MTQQTQERDIAVRLISGLNNMSAARAELKNVVTTLAFVYREPMTILMDTIRQCPNTLSPDEIVRMHFGDWNVWYKRDSWGISGHMNMLLKYTRGSGSDQYTEPHNAKLMRLRKDLSLLIEGMMERFPDYCVQISHILDAADSAK